MALRPLLLATVSTDIAAARGVPVRLVGLTYMLALAVSVGLSSLATGAILSTALLIGPSATALRLARTLTRALIIACLAGIAATWGGILLAYGSYYWEPSRQSLPVSFFIVAILFAAYLASGLPASAGSGGARREDHVRCLHDERLDHRHHRRRSPARPDFASARSSRSPPSSVTSGWPTRCLASSG
ncbi:MAG TPA: metal ABC transporter permease [Streptosporangiaceae bacterium]|nr:metal ABC transporter permease [Streptosporangiaceae bacterium]